MNTEYIVITTMTNQFFMDPMPSTDLAMSYLKSAMEAMDLIEFRTIAGSQTLLTPENIVSISVMNSEIMERDFGHRSDINRRIEAIFEDDPDDEPWK